MQVQVNQDMQSFYIQLFYSVLFHKMPKGSVWGVLLNGLDFEVETDEGEDQALDILHKVVEASKPFLVSAVVRTRMR